MERNRGPQKELIDRTFAFCSTHRGLSIILTCQNFVHQVPTSVRRMCSHFAFWPPTDGDQRPKYARAASQSLDTMDALLDLVEEEESPHAFVLVNVTGQGEPYMLNGVTPVDLVAE